MKKFYGQNGEDCVLWSIFNKKKIGFFLDVGALDGLRFSNTYGFEKAGWKGICVEAHPLYIPMCKKNRPNSIVVHAAISYCDKKECVFYANKFGSLSTLDPSMEKYFRRYSAFKGFEKIKVPMRKIDTILKENNISKVDVVSMDIEGTELDALKGFNLAKYKPAILVIEAMTKDKYMALVKHMRKNNYFYARKVSNNYFFCRNKGNLKIIKNAKVVPRKDLIHIKHPLK